MTLQEDRFKILLLILLFFCSNHFAQQPVLPSPQQILWQEMEQIMFVHFDPAAWQGRELDDHSTPLNRINPDKLDVNQWIDVAESFNAKMIVFVAKHAGGFCWWQTEASDYSIKNTSYKNGKGDVLDDLAKACFARGMKLGVYIYPGDDHWGAYLGGGGKTKDPSRQEAYTRVLRKQWEEVLSRYGKQIVELWFDGNIVLPVEDIVKKYAPSSIAFQGPFAGIRWVGNEQGVCPYPNWYTLKSEDACTGVATAEHSDPEGDVWMPVEVDVPLKNHNWFWSSTNEKNLRNVDQMMDIYYQSVGRGAVLLLNASPDTTGLIPAKDVEIYKQFGAEVKKRFNTSVGETSGKGNLIELKLDNPQTIDHVIIQEDISFGQRIREYIVEIYKDGHWEIVARGLSVGQKRIEKFNPVVTKSIRLRVVNAKYPPIVKRFAAFNLNKDDVYSQQTFTKEERKTGEFKVDREGNFQFDLSDYIPLAEQYTLRIVADNKQIKPEKVELWLQGVETPGFIVIKTDGVCNINITAAPSMEPGTIIIKGKIKPLPKQKSYSIYLK